jgi:hypothetical protein
MTVTRPRWLAGLAVGCAVVVWLALHRLYADLPPLPWSPVATLAVLAIVEGWGGRALRYRLAGRQSRADEGRPAVPRRPLPPLALTRTLAIAKASANAAAVIGGIAAGFAVYLAPSLDKATPRSDAITALATFAAAAALTAGALYLERSCRVPPAAGSNARSGVGHHGT